MTDKAYILVFLGVSYILYTYTIKSFPYFHLWVTSVIFFLLPSFRFKIPPRHPFPKHCRFVYICSCASYNHHTYHFWASFFHFISNKSLDAVFSYFTLYFKSRSRFSRSILYSKPRCTFSYSTFYNKSLGAVSRNLPSISNPDAVFRIILPSKTNPGAFFFCVCFLPSTANPDAIRAGFGVLLICLEAPRITLRLSGPR